MAKTRRNHTRYNSVGLFLADTVTEQSEEEDLEKIQVQFFNKLQSFSFDVQTERKNVKQIGSHDYLTRKMFKNGSININFDYLLTDGYEEKALGLNILGPSVFYDKEGNKETVTINESGSIYKNFKENKSLFFVLGEEGADLTSYDRRPLGLEGTNVLGVGNAHVSSYSFNASVGSMAKASVSMTASDFNFDCMQAGGGFYWEKLTETFGNLLLQQDQGEQDLILFENLEEIRIDRELVYQKIGGVRNPSLDLVNHGQPLDKVGLPIFTFRPKLYKSAATCIPPGGINVRLKNLNIGGPTTSIDGSGSCFEGRANIQSFDVNLPFERESYEGFGSRHIYGSKFKYPQLGTFSMSLLTSTFESGRFLDVFCDDRTYEIEIDLSNKCSYYCYNNEEKESNIKFKITNATLDGYSINQSMGSFGTVDCTFSFGMGENAGLFASGTYGNNKINECHGPFDQPFWNQYNETVFIEQGRDNVPYSTVLAEGDSEEIEYELAGKDVDFFNISEDGSITLKSSDQEPGKYSLALTAHGNRRRRRAGSTTLNLNVEIEDPTVYKELFMRSNISLNAIAEAHTFRSNRAIFNIDIESEIDFHKICLRKPDPSINLTANINNLKVARGYSIRPEFNIEIDSNISAHVIKHATASDANLEILTEVQAVRESIVQWSLEEENVNVVEGSSFVAYYAELSLGTESVTYSIDNSDFNIMEVGGVVMLYFNNLFDYDVKSSHVVNLTAQNSARQDTLKININVVEDIFYNISVNAGYDEPGEGLVSITVDGGSPRKFNEEITVNIVTEEGYQFDSWSSDYNEINGSTNQTLTFNMPMQDVYIFGNIIDSSIWTAKTYTTQNRIGGSVYDTDEQGNKIDTDENGNRFFYYSNALDESIISWAQKEKTIYIQEPNTVVNYDVSLYPGVNGGNITYTLSGQDSDLFNITTEGSLSLKSPSDSQLKSSYSVNIVATNELSDFDILFLTIQINQ